MLFVEFRFFIFFAVVFALVWIFKSNTARKTVLTLASFVFYAAWDVRFLALILFVIGASYFVAPRVAPTSNDAGTRKRYLTLGIASVLAVLAIFKYFNFFTETFADLATTVGLPFNAVTLSIVLPVGISFYTFQAISYLVDSYRGDAKPQKSLRDVAFYIAFFPQLVAGPIVRASHFLPQIETTRHWSDVNVQACLTLFLIGFIKKACVSDNIAPYVDMIFNTPETFTAPTVVAGVLLYGVQIYCDFSGYTDMAIACAGLLGYQFTKNFNAPYLATNIQDFWRRWHISLSTWLRDYLYIPLGGSHNGTTRMYLSLMATMLLGGLWHGASINFVVWGALHGLALVFYRAFWNSPARTLYPSGAAGKALGTFATFYYVNLLWIFFRSETLPAAISTATTYLTWQSPGLETLPINAWGLLAGLASAHVLWQHFKLTDRFSRLAQNHFAVIYGAVAALAIAFVPLGYRPFIYFQF